MPKTPFYSRGADQYAVRPYMRDLIVDARAAYREVRAGSVLLLGYAEAMRAQYKALKQARAVLIDEYGVPEPHNNCAYCGDPFEAEGPSQQSGLDPACCRHCVLFEPKAA